MKSIHLSRRTLLRGGAGAAISLPLLEVMQPKGRQAHANSPKRFVAYAQPLSIYAGYFFPTEPGATPFDHNTMPLPDKFATGQGALDNKDFSLPPLLASFAPHRNDFTVIEGLDNSTGNHGAYSSSLTGTRGVENQSQMRSLDQHLATIMGKETRFPSLQVSVANDGSDGKQALSWYAPGQAAPATKNPSQLFDRLFSDFKSDPAEAAKLRAEKKSVLDAALSQAKALQMRLGKRDNEKLDNFLTSFRSVEASLDKAGGVVCAAPDRPAESEEIRHHGGHENIPIHTGLQLEMIALALACDLSRVITFQLASEANNFTFPWLGVSTRWHDMSHYRPGQDWQMASGKQRTEAYIKMSRWSMDQVSGFITRLKQLDVFAGTTLLFFAPMHHGGQHSGSSIPILVAGDGGGAFRMGRHLRVDRSNNKKRHINDILLALGQHHGLNAKTFGDPALNQGPFEPLLHS